MSLEIDDFIDEMNERINELEELLLSFNNGDDIGNIFRNVHTIKGVAGMFDYVAIVQMTHSLETLFDLCRQGEREVTKEIVDISLKYVDMVKLLIQENADFTGLDSEIETIIERINGIIEGEKSSSLFSKLTVETVPQIREEVLKHLKEKDTIVLDLAETVECDALGVHFLCSLVPLCIHKKKVLKVINIPNIVLYKAALDGIELINVLKRAEFVDSVDNTAKLELTITLHPTLEGDWDRMMEEFHSILNYLGDEITTITLYQNGKVLSDLSLLDKKYKDFTSATVNLLTVKPKRKIEDFLRENNQEMNWTLSLSTKRDQPSIIKKIDTGGDIDKLIILFKRLFKLLKTEKYADANNVIHGIEQLQNNLPNDIESLSFHDFRKAMKVIAGK